MMKIWREIGLFDLQMKLEQSGQMTAAFLR